MRRIWTSLPPALRQAASGFAAAVAGTALLLGLGSGVLHRVGDVAVTVRPLAAVTVGLLSAMAVAWLRDLRSGRRHDKR